MLILFIHPDNKLLETAVLVTSNDFDIEIFSELGLHRGSMDKNVCLHLRH